jgi:hypothetical protein
MFDLQNFAANVTQAPENLGKINVQVKKPDDTIEAGAQVQQMINAECVDDYPGKSKQKYLTLILYKYESTGH